MIEPPPTTEPTLLSLSILVSLILSRCHLTPEVLPWTDPAMWRPWLSCTVLDQQAMPLIPTFHRSHDQSQAKRPPSCPEPLPSLDKLPSWPINKSRPSDPLLEPSRANRYLPRSGDRSTLSLDHQSPHVLLPFVPVAARSELGPYLQKFKLGKSDKFGYYQIQFDLEILNCQIWIIFYLTISPNILDNICIRYKIAIN